MSNSIIGYWNWFIKGSGYKPGYRRLINWWLVLHLAIGLALAFIIDITLVESARTVLFPFAGIFIGLTFAWAVNAQALMRTQEIEQLSEHHPGGFIEYVYTYQTAILAILITLIFWGLAGLKLFDSLWPTTEGRVSYFIIKLLLFCLSSLSLRECWHVVYGTSQLLLIQRAIRKKQK
jgi:hypothetical protein